MTHQHLGTPTIPTELHLPPGRPEDGGASVERPHQVLRPSHAYLRLVGNGVESVSGRSVEAVDGALQDPVGVRHRAQGGVDTPGAVGCLAVVPGVFL